MHCSRHSFRRQWNRRERQRHCVRHAIGRGPRAHRARAIAGLPDRGQLLAYTAGAPFSRSAYTWHSVALSEDHALNAIATGTLDVPAPDGSTIALKFDHAVDHGDGNWTWIGRPAGTKPGTEAIITFGPKAVFGTVPYGRKPALRIGSAQGRTFLMETDPVKLARLDNVGHRPTGPDYVVPPALAGARDKVLAARGRAAQAAGAGRRRRGAGVQHRRCRRRLHERLRLAPGRHVAGRDALEPSGRGRPTRRSPTARSTVASAWWAPSR